MTAYDNVILQHYKNVAKTQSNNDSCTMDDQAIRDLEKTFIINSLFVKFFDSALPVGVDEFSPLRCNIFRKQ